MVMGKEAQRTSTNQPIDQRLLAFEQILVQQTLPIVPHSDELVFEEIDKCALVTETPSVHLSYDLCGGYAHFLFPKKSLQSSSVISPGASCHGSRVSDSFS